MLAELADDQDVADPRAWVVDLKKTSGAVELTASLHPEVFVLHRNARLNLTAARPAPSGRSMSVRQMSAPPEE
jgi:hypothetical protein